MSIAPGYMWLTPKASEDIIQSLDWPIHYDNLRQMFKCYRQREIQHKE